MLYDLSMFMSDRRLCLLLRRESIETIESLGVSTVSAAAQAVTMLPSAAAAASQPLRPFCQKLSMNKQNAPQLTWVLNFKLSNGDRTDR